MLSQPLSMLQQQHQQQAATALAQQQIMRPSKAALITRKGRRLLEEIKEDPEVVLDRLLDENYKAFESRQIPKYSVCYR